MVQWLKNSALMQTIQFTETMVNNTGLYKKSFTDIISDILIEVLDVLPNGNCFTILHMV